MQQLLLQAQGELLSCMEKASPKGGEASIVWTYFTWARALLTASIRPLEE